jgi:hypothetical protein
MSEKNRFFLKHQQKYNRDYKSGEKKVFVYEIIIQKKKIKSSGQKKIDCFMTRIIKDYISFISTHY